jgi:hypothetical protein
MTKEESIKRRLQEAYQRLFQGEDAELVIEDLRLRACADQPAFVPGLEPWQPAYRDGARSIFRYIVSQTKAPRNINIQPTIIKS